ncbi:MAG: hypothetical protein AAFY65_18475 [Pseudomonadota bacterium]
MITDFEKDVKKNYIEAKLGNRIHEIAEVDLHFVLPLAVFERYESQISEITGGEFNVGAGYNLVLLYTKPEDSQLAGTALFGRELDGLIAAWSNILDEIAAIPEPESRYDKFKAACAYFRSNLCHRPDIIDPCASENPLVLRKAESGKPAFWKRWLS